MDIQIERQYYDNGKIRFEKYFTNNKLHREDGPAVIYYYDNGYIESEKHYINGKRHREDEPAVANYYKNGSIKSEHYCVNDEWHREDGPACMQYNKNGSIRTINYYLNGYRVNMNKYSNINYNQLINLIILYNDTNELLKLKLITNIKFKKQKDILLELIESKITMLTLVQDN